MELEATDVENAPRKLRALNRIARFRLRERFYKDGKPQWLVSRKNKPCETSDQAENYHRIAVNRFRRLARETSDEIEASRLKSIADIIRTCRPYDRCHHPACPLCLRALQRWFVWTGPTALKIASRRLGGRIAAVCIIPDLRLTPSASLEHSRDQVARVLALFDRAFDRTSGLCLIGGIDISVNVPEKSDIESGRDVERLQLHVWALAPEDQIRTVELLLRRCFPTNRVVKDAVRIDPWDGDNRAFAYALKTSFVRRISLEPRMRSGRMGRNTRNKPLSVKRWGRVMLILEIIGARRLVMVNSEITLDHKGRPVIRPIKTRIGSLSRPEKANKRGSPT